MLRTQALPSVARAHLRASEVRVEHLWSLLVLATPFIAAAGVSFTTDSWWVLKMGRLAVEAGWPPINVVMAHASAVPEAANQQWLAQVAIYLVYAGFGEDGTRVAAGLLAVLTFGLLLRVARLGGASPRSAALGGLLAVVLAGSNLIVRAQLLCYPLFVLTLLLLQGRVRQPRRLWLLPAILAFWANLHGSFVLGLLLLVLHAVGDSIEMVIAGRKIDHFVRARLARWALLATASFLATWLNPLGPRVYAYLGSVTTDPSIRGLVTEWRPSTIHEPTGLVLAASMLVLFVAVRYSRRPVLPTEALLLVAFGYLALDALRSVVWWGLVLGPIVARHLAEVRLPSWLERRRRAEPRAGSARPVFNLALAILIVAYAGLSPLWLPLVVKQPASSGADPARPSTASTRPSGPAAELLAGLPAGSRLYHFQPWSGYLAWRLWPDQQPMLDARIEAHPPAVWNDYLAVNGGRTDWEAILDRYQVDYLVLEPTFQASLVRLASSSGRWTELYEDRTAIVLGRAPS